MYIYIYMKIYHIFSANKINNISKLLPILLLYNVAVTTISINVTRTRNVRQYFFISHVRSASLCNFQPTLLSLAKLNVASQKIRRN